MSQPIMNKVLYFNNNRDREKYKKSFEIFLIRKLISPLNVPANRGNLSIQIYFMARPRDFSKWKETKISNLIFKAKYYLVGPKIILMLLYFIFFQIDSSLFPPLE